MNLKLYVAPVALVAIGVFVHQERIAEIGAAYTERTAANAETSESIHKTAKDSQQRLVDSGRALQRFKSGCIRVVEPDSGQPMRFAESQSVTVAKGAPMSFDDGEVVCNTLGDTAIVQDGQPTDIARIAPEHEDEFLPLKNQLLRN